MGVSPAIMPNPERGDYETLVVSRSVLSGSTKLMFYTLNPSVASTAVTVVRMRFIHTDHLFFVSGVMVFSFHLNGHIEKHGKHE